MSTVLTATELRVAPRFSNHFHIGKKQAELDFVDILLDTDIRLYIDPFALSVEEDEWSKRCNNLIVGFFQDVVDSIRGQNLDRAKILLSNLHEPNETRLGQSSRKPRGRGVGGKQARDLYGAIAKSKAVETGLLTDLSDCELFIDGIGHDKISDIATNVIRRELIEFTKEQCRKWGVPMQFSPTGPWWDAERKHWRSTYDYLPVYLGYPLILVPKRAVRYAMCIDDRKFYNLEVVEFIRQNYNRAECLNPLSSLFMLLRAGERVTKKDVAAAFPKSKEFLREFAELFPEVLARYKRKAKREAKWAMPSDGEIYELERQTAHDQGSVLVEELNIYMTTNSTNIGRDNLGAIGQGEMVVIKDVKVYKAGVDSATTITDETKDLLKRAFDAIESAPIDGEDKDDAKGNLQKLTEELEGDKEPGRISRYLTRIAQVVQPAADIIKGGGEIAHLLSQLPGLGG